VQWRARVVAPILAAVLGTSGGVATALMLGGGSGVPSFADPLGLGIPLHNLPCDSDESILVVGHGASRAALGPGVANNKKDARYLATADSCHTQLGPEHAADVPVYVAYTGPFHNLDAACTVRMTAFHRTDYVAVLRQGNTQLVKCPCVLPNSVAPELSISDKPSADDLVWARSLQGMLNDADPDGFPTKRISGNYDEFTRRYVLQEYQAPAGYLGRNGLMDTETWRIVTNRVCSLYNY
jgi:hypothetical protein